MQHKKDVGELLAQGKNEQARIRTVSVILEDYSIEVFNLMVNYLNTILIRMDLIETQKYCPPEALEAVCSVVYAAPYLENDAKFGEPELMKVRKVFLQMYGKKFPQECVQNGCVNPKLLHHLGGKQPSDDLVDFYLDAITGKKNLDWEYLLGQDDKKPEPLDVLTPSSEEKSVSVLQALVEETAVISVDKSGNVWGLDANNQRPPCFIPKDEVNGAENGDTVVVQLHPRTDNKRSGKVTKILEKAKNQIIVAGTLIEDNNKNAWVLDANGKIPPMFILAKELQGAAFGDDVYAQLIPRSDSKIVGKILKVN